jgi:glycosyltransferase involved in cell wall biosynthesis
MSRPRVLHMIETLRPYGAGQSMTNVCHSLEERYEPFVAAFFGGALGPMLEEMGIRVVTMAPSKEGRSKQRGPFTLLRRWRFCQRAVRDVTPDIVHTHSDSGNTLGRIAAHLHGIPTVAHLRGPEELCGTWIYRAAYRLAQRGCTRVVAVSDGIGEAFQKATGIPTRTIYNAVDERRFAHPDSAPGDIRRELGLTGGDFVVGTLAGFNPMKDYPALLRCAQRCCAVAEDVHFVCAGDGPRYAEMTQLRDELGLASKVHFLGYRDDVVNLLRGFDAFILMSEGEGFARSIIEAMLMGLPVVATDVVGINEALDDGVEGFLVPAGDAEAAAQRVLELYHNPELRRAMGQAGLARAQARHSLAGLADNIARVYEELLAEAGRRR